MDYMKDKYPLLLLLLEKRFALAEKYLELTEGQEALIASEDEEALLESLSAREALANELDSANKETDGALREYEAIGKGTETARADELINSTRELYVKCLTLDRKNMISLKAQMNKASGESKELQKRREGINKYAQADYIFTPSILDNLK